MQSQPAVISASRRTDIPHYFARWFAERWKDGRAEYRTAFGTPGSVSLREADVLGFLFWTKNAAPFQEQLLSLRDSGIPYAFQYTVNGYGAPLEAYIPPVPAVLGDFLKVAQDLPDARCIQWRYDPIVLSDQFDARSYHPKRFRDIATALKGATRVVNVSICEPYVKTVRRVGEVLPSAVYRSLDPERNKTVLKRHPTLPQAQAGVVGDLVSELSAIAADHGIEVRACCNAELELSEAQCCGPELFAGYGPEFENRMRRLPKAPTRESCRCLKSVDIGMDNTCLGGCRYCYVVTSHETAVANFSKHRPSSASLR